MGGRETQFVLVLEEGSATVVQAVEAEVEEAAVAQPRLALVVEAAEEWAWVVLVGAEGWFVPLLVAGVEEAAGRALAAEVGVVAVAAR